MVTTLRFRGSNCLRQRIILSLLTSKQIIIEDVRPDGGGLQEFEMSLLELVEKITSGTTISSKNSRLQINPGTIVGGQITHSCHNSRSISYYLEVLLCLAPFCKKPLQATLKGVTNDQIDPSVDRFKASAIPVMKKFIGSIEDTKLDIKITARGFKPEGGGSILFTCPMVRQLQPVQWTDVEKVKRIRGVSVAARMAPQLSNRMVNTSKGMLLQFIPDVYIYSDHTKGKACGQSPGFSLALAAETTDGTIYSSDAVSNFKGSGKGPSIPEELAKDATYRLFEEIERGGCVDSISQSLALTLMTFNQKDVSKIRFGNLTMYTIHYLRHLREFCGITFQLSPVGDNEVIALCSGLGYKNMNRATH